MQGLWHKVGSVCVCVCSLLKIIDKSNESALGFKLDVWCLRYISVFGTRCVCFTLQLIPLAGQRCALFHPGHPRIAAQLLRFWLYFMSPNCDWPGPPLASFHPSEEGSAPSCSSGAAVYWPPPSRDGEGHVSSSSSPWVVWLSAYLHLSARAGSSLHPSPSGFSLRLFNIPSSAHFTALKQHSSIVYQH